jgi:hypothetical protein
VKAGFIVASRSPDDVAAKFVQSRSEGLRRPYSVIRELSMNYPHLHLMINHVPVLGTILALLLLTWALVTRPP